MQASMPTIARSFYFAMLHSSTGSWKCLLPSIELGDRLPILYTKIAICSRHVTQSVYASSRGSCHHISLQGKLKKSWQWTGTNRENWQLWSSSCQFVTTTCLNLVSASQADFATPMNGLFISYCLEYVLLLCASHSSSYGKGRISLKRYYRVYVPYPPQSTPTRRFKKGRY